MGKITKTDVWYACDNCGKKTTSREDWYGIQSKRSIFSSGVIFCTEACAKEWPLSQVTVVKLSGTKVYDMFAEPEPYRVMGNTD